LHFMADMGFRSFEDNNMKQRPIQLQEQIAQLMQKRGMQMGVFVAHTIFWEEPNLASGNAEWREAFLNEIKEAIEVAKRVNAKWMTVVPGHLDLRQDMGYQTANVVETLKQASALLEPHDLCMVLEPLNFRDHPGLFLTKAAQAYQICKAVNSPSCKILFDIYHQQITEGNIIPNIDACWDEIAYFQIGDNPGRKEPTTGEINYKNVFQHIHSKGFNGILGMEHGNSTPGKNGENKVIAAYRACDV
ncbi:MAG: TIM barrel protein, partial [Saprospiraceae bacterium]|nr:TIM barrel protein [Saprospiraceae bacterium]